MYYDKKFIFCIKLILDIELGIYLIGDFWNNLISIIILVRKRKNLLVIKVYWEKILFIWVYNYYIVLKKMLRVICIYYIILGLLLLFKFWLF